MVDRTVALYKGFIDSVDSNAQRIALDAPAGQFSYETLFNISASIAASLIRGRAQGVALTAVLADRDIDAFSGILGILMSGHGYVPLNPASPVERTARMLNKIACDTIILGRTEIELGLEVIEECPFIARVIVPGISSHKHLLSKIPPERDLTIITSADMDLVQEWNEPEFDPKAIAYLLFTSGSTGEPKGVMVSHASISHFLSVMQERYHLGPDDRVSQMFELGFDLSLFDMFMSWGAGACLCVPSRGQVLLPANYIRDSQLSVWFSVPSAAVLMKKLRLLQPGSLPSLRISLFCGEALPCDATAAWALAAPQSIIENLYGPTELTLACTLYRWRGEKSEGESVNGMVPIGSPYPGMRALIIDNDMTPINEAEIGELAVAGPQVALGYWKDPERTASVFVEIESKEGIFYRTGDLVKRVSPDGPLVCLGRIDQQIKLHGHRIELGEIEAALNELSDGCQCVVVPWPIRNGVIGGLIAFVESAPANFETAYKPKLALKLPGYMVPNDLRNIERLPLNSNGKIDRTQLRAILEAEHE